MEGSKDGGRVLVRGLVGKKGWEKQRKWEDREEGEVEKWEGTTREAMHILWHLMDLD